MKKVLQLVILSLSLLLFFPFQVSAQESSYIGEHFRARVENIQQEKKIDVEGQEFYVQTIEFRRLDTGEIIITDVGSDFQPLNPNQRLAEGQVMILAEQTIPTPDGEETQIVVVDVYRNHTMLWLLGIFVVAVLVVAEVKGFKSLIGMALSLGVLVGWIIPQILAGQNPILISLMGSGAIATITIYLSHGWSAKSHLALASMLATLIAVASLSSWAVYSAQIVGLGSEEAYFLQFGQTAKINLQGLLLGGIMLGVLGVLDDICVTQISVVWQLKSVNKKLTLLELYNRSLAVGKDHVASLVNTLVLAYAGANLPLFLLFTINQQVPLWVTFSSEIILEEVLRTLIGSIGLVLAVPITTLAAAYYATRYPKQISTSGHHHH